MIHSCRKEELDDAAKISYSVSDVVRNLNLKLVGGNHTHIRNQLKSFDIDCSHFDPNRGRRANINSRKLTKDDVLVVSTRNRRTSAKYLRMALKDSSVDYRCVECGNDGSWQGKDIVLQVDHIDGNWSNNQIENLRFLCPNCHSQTPNYGRTRIAKQVKKTCPKCGVNINSRSITCQKCSNRKRSYQSKRPSLEVLKQDLKDLRYMVKIGDKYSVSDNAVRKWLRHYGLL